MWILMAHFLEQYKNALGKYLEGMVLETHKKDRTACLPQMYSREWTIVHWELKFSLANLEVTKTVLVFWLWEELCAIPYLCGSGAHTCAAGRRCVYNNTRACCNYHPCRQPQWNSWSLMGTLSLRQSFIPSGGSSVLAFKPTGATLCRTFYWFGMCCLHATWVNYFSFQGC